MASTIYTLGYQGRSLAEYIAILEEHGVGLVIDVRAAAWSRKPGFSKGPMQQGLKESGIEYMHLSSAGNPFRKDDDENIMEKYRTYLRSHQSCLDTIEAEMHQAAKAGVCLTCFEKEPQDCHRSIVAEFLLERNPRLHVVHLGAESDQLSLLS